MINSPIGFKTAAFYAVVASVLIVNCTSPIDEKTALPAPKLYQPLSGTTDLSITPKLVWTMVNDAAMYRLQISTSNPFSNIVMDDSSITEAFKTISGLAYNKTYYWRVQAINTDESSPWSEIWSFSTKHKDTLASPGLFQPVNGSTNQPLSLTMIWTSVSGAAVYELQVSGNPGFTSIFHADTSLPNTFKTISGFSKNDTMYWRVRAKNADTISNWSNSYSFSTKIILPPKITIDAIGAIEGPLPNGAPIVYKNVTGSISADTSITSIAYQILTSTGVIVPSTQISVTGPAASGEKGMNFTSTSPVRIVISSSAAAGTYRLKISATAIQTTEASFDFTVIKTPVATITINAIGAFDRGTYKDVTGSIAADTTISSVSYQIYTSSDILVTSGITVAGPSAQGTKTMDFTSASPIRITASASAAAGTYKLKISATAIQTTEASFYFTVTGTSGTPVTTATVTIGSMNNAAVGSSIDLDNGTVTLAAAATADGSGIDIVGTYSTSLSVMRIFNPVYAKNNSGIAAFAAWINPAATSFVKISGITFASITTVEQMGPLYTAGTAVTSSSCVTGDVFIVKTDQNKYVAIEIGVFDANATGTCNIKFAK